MEAWARGLRATIVVAIVAAFTWFAGTAGLAAQPRGDLARHAEAAWVEGHRDVDALVARPKDEPARVVDRRSPGPSTDLGVVRLGPALAPPPAPAIDAPGSILLALRAPPPSVRSAPPRQAWWTALGQPPARGPPAA